MLLFQFAGIAEHWLSDNDWANFRAWARHPDAAAVITELRLASKRGVFEVGRADAEDDRFAEVVGQAGLGVQDVGGYRELVSGEGDRRAVVPDQLGVDEVHRGGADEPGHEQVDR